MEKERPRLFFVIEGNDGSGQTTQGDKLALRLKSQGIPYWLTAEPTGSLTGLRVRGMLGGKERVTAEKLQDTFISDRRGHVSQIMLHLDKGDVVISVRYKYSTYAYGMAGGLNLEVLMDKNKTFPDATKVFYLDLSVPEAQGRVDGRGKPKEITEKGEYPKKVHAAYNMLLNDGRFPELIRIDATGSPEEVHERIFAEVEKELGELIT